MKAPTGKEFLFAAVVGLGFIGLQLVVIALMVYASTP